MRLLFCGTPEAAIPAFEAIHNSPHEMVAVLTRPDARTGRGRTLKPSPIKERATELGVTVLTPDTLSGPEIVQTITDLGVDCAPVVAYGALIPENLLAVPHHGWVNLHFSLLPAWRGAAPVQHAIWHGDDVTGATTFLIEKGLDTGPTFGTVTEDIHPSDTSSDLMNRLAVSGAQLLLATIDALESGHAHPQSQPSYGISIAGKITVLDARLNWDSPALALSRHVRACTPAPGAWTELAPDGPEAAERLRLKIAPIDLGEPSDEVPELPPGHIHATKRAVFIGTGSTPIRLTEVSPAGKPWMSAADWARGARLSNNAQFVNH